MVVKQKTLVRFLVSAALILLLGWLIFGSPFLVHADAILTIEPITWNVVGLDSNNVTVGPNNFPVGVRVCNTGDDLATNVSADFIWDSSDSYISLRTGSLDPITTSSIAAGDCFDFYFEVEISRDANAYDHTREYHIEVSSTETSTISTPTPREIYVEHLISQSRNSTTDVLLDTVSIAPGGTMTLMLGETYDIELVGSTATNGYEQIESYINFPNTIFQINSVTSTYTANGGTDPDAATKVYADGCSWENDPNSPNYRSCLSTGKYGGNITVTYNVTIIGGAGTSETLNTLIYDFSGSSYLYNSDFSVAWRIAAIVDPSLVTIDKNFAPDPTSVTGTSTLTFTLSNPNSVAISDASFTDTFPTNPGAMTVASPATYSTNSCGTPTFAPAAGVGSISFSDGTIPANGSCTVSVQVSTTAIGTYDNTSGNLYIDTTDTGNSASDSLVVNDDPSSPAPICGYVLSEWTVPSTATDPPDSTGGVPTTQASDVSTAAATVGSGLAATSIATNQGYNDNYSWRADGGFETGAFDPSQNNFFRFQVDTGQYTQVSLTFWAWRTKNGPEDLYIYYGTAGSPPETLKTSFTEALGTGIGSARTWTSFSIDFTDNTSTTGDTYFYIYGTNSNNSNPGADLHLDLITFNGCQIPDLPTLAKSFSPDPIAVNGTSTLTFTLTNPNTVDLTGAAFDDTYPAGLVNETPANASTTCTGGTVTAADGGGSVSLSGGTIPASGTCVVTVDVTATTSGPHTNVSGFISTTETGENTGPDGSATDTLTAISPPVISKQFAPNPILVNGTSTLTFTITNPNPDDQLTNVAFSDTYPTNVVNAAAPVTSSTCGGVVTAAAGLDTLAFSGGTIAGGGTCTVQVDVTSAVDASYANTSGNVSADLVGNGNTASDTLVVEPIRPSISLLKQVSSTGAAPWTTFIGVNVGDSVWYQFTVENTGDVALTGVNVTDPTLTGLGVDLSSCSWANLALYETQTCLVGPVIAVSGSNSNTATAHGTYNLTEYTDISTATYATTGLTLVKTAAESTFTAAGDVLHYSYLVTNSGFAPLAGPVTIDDDKAIDESCPDVDTVGDFDAFLDPGESITCTATYTVTAGDVTDGFVTNTADATVEGVTSNSDSETVTAILAPTVTKTFVVDTIVAGGTSTLTIEIVNPNAGTGLTGVGFTDNLPAGVSVASAPNETTTGCGTPTFAPVATDTSLSFSGGTIAVSGTCTVEVDVTSSTPGTVTNTTSVVSSNEAPDSGTASDDLTVVNPELTLVKTIASGDPYSSVGDVLNYSFDVTNSGNVTLDGPFTVADDRATDESCPATATLAPGISITCTASYVVTQADIDNGSVTNTATASGSFAGNPVTSAPDSETANATQSPALNVTKTETSTGPYNVGDTITYDIDVDNTGNVTLTGVTVSDPDTTVGVCTPVQPSTLAPGATMTCPASYVVTQADVDAGSFTNTATGDSNETGPDTGSETVTFTQTPDITLVKTITSGDPYSSVGDIVNYSFDVTNSGNVTLDGPFTVADDRATDESCPATATLAPGISITCTASYTVTQADIDNGSVTNTATASGSFTGNPVTSGPDSETANAAVLIVIDPGVTKSGDPLTAQVGDTVTFTLFVFNIGNADADNVIVTDVIPSFLDIIPPVVISPLGPGVTITGNTIVMDFGTVEPSESWTVTITTVVNALGVPPGDSNDVTLVTTSDDADLDNNDDSVFITISGDGPLLPGTGFAPNRVTALPQMPAYYAYLSYGELRLEIPKLDVDTSIVGVPRDGDGWDVTWLWDKAGYLGGTAFPTWSGNSVITGHVVLANGLEGPFVDLKELEYGDAVIVHGWGEQYIYEIREVDIASPYDPSVLRHEEYPWLTLVTCAGFDEKSDSYRWRVVARAVMVLIDSEVGSWTSSSSLEQHDIQTFDRVRSGGVQP